VLDIEAPTMDSARMRRAGKGLLSLALIDARNHALRWTAAFERGLDAAAMKAPAVTEVDSPLWALGHLGWFQEYWIARNVQRQRGEHCDPNGPRLASILPDADLFYDPSLSSTAGRRRLELPDLASTRQYLVDTLETTLELLDATPDDDDDTLYFYRLALFHEDMHLEQFAVAAQTLGLDAGLLPAQGTFAPRAPLLFPATRWTLGSDASGFVFDNEREPHEIALPEFEIDAQAVSWAQFCEFVEDGGYDRRDHWSESGWAWLQREGRRTPRHVDQMRHGVLARRFGKLVRVPLAQPVVHVSWFEADAWCRWAGRRLPAEVEWEAAAHQGATRGFRWGDVWEWTASSFRAYPGFVPGPLRDYSQPCFGSHKVLRGASFATRARLRSAKFRHFLLPERDEAFAGFRSCAA
jgi:ergothioneine biosynthesis protein EgtB